jgi:putative transposase
VVQGTGVPSPWSGLKNQIYLASDAFVAKMQSMIDPERALDEVPKPQRRPVAKPLEHFAVRYND